MLADWMRELIQIKFAVAAMAELHEAGTISRENALNAARGIEARLDWILDQAQKETKREPR